MVKLTMRHQILTGPFSALEQRFSQTVRAQQSGNPLAPVSVLVGSNLLASHLKYYIADLGHSVANLRFHTFLDLARSLSSAKRLMKPKARLPQLGTSWILEEILEQTPEVFREVSRSEEHTSELQSQSNLVCRLLLEKKK